MIFSYDYTTVKKVAYVMLSSFLGGGNYGGNCGGGGGILVAEPAFSKTNAGEGS